MWKYIAVLVLLLGFTAPVHAENDTWEEKAVYKGEVDGKGLACTLIKNPLNDGPKYYLFENGRVNNPYVDDTIPLEIRTNRFSQHKYKTTVNSIQWGPNHRYVLDRKTLVLNFSGEPFLYCQLMEPKDIEAALLKEIEELKEIMKDNKI